MSSPLILALRPWLIWPPVAFVLAWLLLRVSARVAFGRPLSPAAHWTERARLTFPGARWANAGPFVVTLLLLLLWRESLFDGTLAGRLLGALTGLAAFTGGLLAAVTLSGRYRIPVTLGEAFRSLAISFLFFAPALLPGLLAGLLMGWRAEELPPGPVMGVAVAVIVVLLAGGSYRLARLVGWVQPPDPRAMLALQEAARRDGGMPHSCGLLRWRMVNALAFPLNRSILITRGAMEALDDEELVLLCLHELAHLREPWLVTGARALAVFVYLPLLWCGPLVNWLGLWGVAGPLLLLIVGARLSQRLALRMEQRADASAAARQEHAGAYARMLEKIHRLNLIPAVLGPRQGAHPHLYDRMAAAGVTPAYPRPLRPPRGRVFRAALVAGVGLFLAAPFLESRIANWLARPDDPDSPSFEEIMSE